MQTERFNDTNIDGETIMLAVMDTQLLVGNRFEANVRIPLGGMEHENKEKIRWALDFFRNYACLLRRDELKRGWQCYQRAKKQLSTGMSSAFWHYLDGKRLVRRGKSVIQWV